MLNPQAGKRGWYLTKKGQRPFFWTGKVDEDAATMGVCYFLQVQPCGPGYSLRKIVAVKRLFYAVMIRGMTSGERVEPPVEIDGLPTTEAVKVAES